MKKLFEPVRIGGLTSKNRVVRSATVESAGSVNGVIAPYMTEVYQALVDGGVGFLIAGMSGVGPNSCVSDKIVRIYDDSYVKNFSALADTVHRGDCRVVVQISNCGGKTTYLDGDDHAWAPSDGEVVPNNPAKAMTLAQIDQVVNDFGKAALRCKQAGADGVQIHAAHGYLLSEFLSPFYNRREDDYGGSIENRARMLFRVYDEVRNRVGPDFKVMLKINYSDLVEPGITGDEAIWVCKELDRLGIDAIEVSSGVGHTNASRPAQPVKSQADEGFFLEGALRIADAVSCTVHGVGGYRTPAVIEEALNKGKLEAVSLSRPLIYKPDLLAQWQSGDLTPSKCVSCNLCYQTSRHGCAVQNPSLLQK